MCGEHLGSTYLSISSILFCKKVIEEFPEFLLDFNTDIDKTDIDLADNDNITPLMFSITSGYGDITRLLVDKRSRC